MGTYLVHRLLAMIPTLFGITVVSFCIMQLAPGDPVANQLASGNAPQGGETSEMYKLRKHELHLDKPLLLNFREFRDYGPSVRAAAFYESRSLQQIHDDLKDLAAAAKDPAEHPEAAERLKFLRSLGIPDFNSRLEHPDKWERLPKLIEHFVGTFCDDTGAVGVNAAIGILENPQSSQKLRIGAVRCLTRMVSRPFAFTYSIHPTDAETRPIVDAWRIWWKLHESSLPKPNAEAKQYFDDCMKQAVISRDKLFSAIDQLGDSDYLPMAPAYFAPRLLGDGTFADKVAASTILKQLVPEPLKYDLPTDASASDVEEATAVWLEHYKLHRAEYEPPLTQKLWNIVADTQYAYMVVRLVTFQFGESALKTREPVSEKIWSAVKVSAPLMFMSYLLIYLISIPLGIICGVYRGRSLDKGISLGLFVLYSIPSFVAGMMFLVFFCYGVYWKIFPALDLHSENADSMSFVPYMLDYFWHAFLPVVCLSLFSLAAMAMYAHSSVLDVISQDYVRTARAKGVSGPMVVVKHVMRNAMIPILTLFSNFLPAMLGGSLLVEFLFNIPGMGRLGLTFDRAKRFSDIDGFALCRSAGDIGQLPDHRLSVCRRRSADQLWRSRRRGMKDGEAYFDIVWRQFKKNRLAHLCLWFVGALVLLAIFAPVIASNVPFVFHDGQKTTYPWWHHVFHPSQAIDTVFNMALVGFFPWMVVAQLSNWLARRAGISGRKRLAIASLEAFVIWAALLMVAYSPKLRPGDPYGELDFPTLVWQDPQRYHGTFAPLPFGPAEIALESRLEPPHLSPHPPEKITKFNERFTHWLGTNFNGEDVLTEMIYGTRISMTVGVVAVSIYLVIGIIVGSIAGYFGGAIDLVLSRIIEIVILFPTLFLILTLVGLLGQNAKYSEQGGQRIYIAMIVIGITGWTGIARLTRGEVLKQRSLDYTLAARALGASHWRVLFRHILPNSLSPALVSIPFGISDAIVIEATLSLLGFGAEPGQPSWGALLRVAYDNNHCWWMAVFPSLAIFVTLTAFNLFGSGLRDAMDPRLRI